MAWEPSEEMLKQFLKPGDDTAMYDGPEDCSFRSVLGCFILCDIS